MANGTVADAGRAGGFTVHEPGGTQVRVTTSGSTKVVLLARVTAAQLRTGQPTVAVGSVTGGSSRPARSSRRTSRSAQLRPAQWYHPLPLPAGFSPVRPGSFPRLRPGGWPWPVRRGFPWPAGLPALLPGPGALFSGLGCNAPAIAVTGLLAFGG